MGPSPTAKLLIAVGVWLFGYRPWAWRLVPALAGVALAPVFYLLARRVLVTDRAAVLATVLLLCDGVYLVQSRIAMTNIFAVLFQRGVKGFGFARRHASASDSPLHMSLASFMLSAVALALGATNGILETHPPLSMMNR